MVNFLKGITTFVFWLLLLGREITGDICSKPYSCKRLRECARIHGKRNLANEVIFYCCKMQEKVCCPPRRKVSKCKAKIREPLVKAIFPVFQGLPTNSTPIGRHKNLNLLPVFCGSPKGTDKVSHGVNATLGEFPWMALLVYKDKNDNTYFKCGGTLISRRYVLTAAHCLSTDASALNYVRLGEHQLSEEEDCSVQNNETICTRASNVPIEKIIPHEYFDPKTFRNDLALLRIGDISHLLDVPNGVVPVCLAINENDLALDANPDLEAVGWGLVEGGIIGENSDILQKVTFKDNDEAECAKKCLLENVCPVSEKQICVEGSRRKDVCHGDSGGPLTVKKGRIYQVGITSISLTAECGVQGVPSIFTRVSKYINWILDNMNP